jgi:hypothetical protein
MDQQTARSPTPCDGDVENNCGAVIPRALINGNVDNEGTVRASPQRQNFDMPAAQLQASVAGTTTAPALAHHHPEGGRALSGAAHIDAEPARLCGRRRGVDETITITDGTCID